MTQILRTVCPQISMWTCIFHILVHSVGSDYLTTSSMSENMELGGARKMGSCRPWTISFVIIKKKQGGWDIAFHLLTVVTLWLMDVTNSMTKHGPRNWIGGDTKSVVLIRSVGNYEYERLPLTSFHLLVCPALLNFFSFHLFFQSFV